MTKNLVEKYREVYVDNFFTSVPLMEYLFSHKILRCGTLGTYKKYLPKNLSKDSDLKRGEYDYIIVYKWRENKVVHVVSNLHGTEQSQVNRKSKDGTVSQVACPEAIKHYNTYMVGVEKADVYCALYRTFHKSKKWWNRIFFGLIDWSLQNAFVVYKKLIDRNSTLLNFRRSVAQWLITLGKPLKAGRSISTPSNQLTANKRQKTNYFVPASIRNENVGIHWVIYDQKRGRCEMCSKKKKSRIKTFLEM